MSSKTQALIVAIIAVIAISGIYILTKSRPAEIVPNNSISSSSQVSNSSSSRAVLSSSSVIVSSSSIGVSKVIEVPKTSGVAIIPKPQTQCNLPESENLVKTEDGCFEIGVGVNTFSDGSDYGNQNKLIQNVETSNLLKKIAKEYYLKNLNQIVTKNDPININGSQFVSNNNFKLFLSIGDPDYLKSKGYNLQSDRSRFNAIYKIYKNGNQWKYEFISENIL